MQVNRWSARALIFAAAAGLGGCASDYGHFGYAGDWYGPGPDYVGADYRAADAPYGPAPAAPAFFGGEGAGLLDPWLAFTPEGREVVVTGFGGGDGRISARTADRANIWFRRYADTNRDMALTDAEIRVALVEAAVAAGGPSY